MGRYIKPRKLARLILHLKQTSTYLPEGFALIVGDLICHVCGFFLQLDSLREKRVSNVADDRLLAADAGGGVVFESYLPCV